MTPAATAPDPRFNREIGVERHVPVQDTMLRALGVLRFVVLLNAIGIYWVRYDGYDHPLAGWLVMGLLVVWTAFAVWAYAAPARRTPVLLVADLLVAVAAIAVSPYVKGEGLNATLPGFWVMGAVLAWAIVWRWVGGLTAAVVVSIADISIRDDITQKIYGNIFLLIVGGAIVGFLSGLLQQMAGATGSCRACRGRRGRAPAARPGGARRGAAGARPRAAACSGAGPRRPSSWAGWRGSRRCSSAAWSSRTPGTWWRPSATATSSQLLAELQSARVHVAVPGTPAMLPAERASEVLAAVESCLSNVRHHVGRDAEAWVLLEELDDRWVVSVRDDGPGIPEGRLEASAAEGRLGRPAVDRRSAARPRGHGDGALGGRSGHRVGARRTAMTIHSEHPFLDPDPDPVRRLRGRLGGAVTLWTSGSDEWAGLTVTSLMVAGGEPGRVLALLDPDSDLADVLGETGRAVVHLLEWEHRDLAEAFAGQLPSPGGPFRMGEWEQTEHGPRLLSASSWASVEVDSSETVGWSDLVIARIVSVELGDSAEPLVHRRGRYRRQDG